MKTLIIILLIPFSLSAQLSEDYSFRQDKVYHAIAGTAISATTFTLVYKKTNDEKLAKRAGIFAGVGAATLKEMFDFMSGGEIMLSDVLYTSVFSIGTSLTMQAITTHRKNKKKILDDTWSLDNEFINKQHGKSIQKPI